MSNRHELESEGGCLLRMNPHARADLMLQYAYDAFQRPDPWNLWQYRSTFGGPWIDCECHTAPDFHALEYQYRRKEPEE